MDERVVPPARRRLALRQRPSLDERAALIAHWEVVMKVWRRAVSPRSLFVGDEDLAPSGRRPAYVPIDRGDRGDGVCGVCETCAPVLEAGWAWGGKRSARFWQAERGTASPGAVAPRMFEAAASAAEFGAPRRRARAKGSLSAGQAAAYERTGAYRHAPKLLAQIAAHGCLPPRAQITRPNQSTKSRRAGLRIDVQNGLDLDGHVVRQRPEAHSAARMAPSLSEHIDEEV